MKTLSDKNIRDNNKGVSDIRTELKLKFHMELMDASLLK